MLARSSSRWLAPGNPGMLSPASSQFPGYRRAHAVKGELYSPSFQRKGARPFNEVPGNWKTGWFNLYHFWQEGGFHNVHNIMARQFQKFGPIYREKLGIYESVNIINPEDAATLFKSEGMFPERFTVSPWVAYRDHRNKSYGVLLKNGEAWRFDRLILNKEVLSPQVMDNFVPLLNEVGEDFVRRVRVQIEKSGRGKWTADFTNELFRFALELCHVLYGERLGLLQDFVDPEAQRFIDAVSMMFHTTSPMLYIPVKLFHWINSKTWQDHVKAWDVIFMQADKCIQNVYRDLRLQRKSAKEYTGILSTLLMQDKLPIDDIKASVTEMMAGGVDTTSMTLQWAMFELARSPGVQEQLRTEIFAAKQAAQGDMLKMLKSVKLLKAAIKETLRLHPVAITLQRYTMQEMVLQDYRIPAKTLVQVGIYAMGRDPKFFVKPEQFNPERWLMMETKYFKGLGFGFGPRQCLGRRIAELEMQLFLIHMLENFKIETKRGLEIGTKFDLILIPDKPIYLTLRPLSAHP
ncbi:cholesterol side-chain cleavage enzyme, mitochondrial isoform X2 [Alligator mississippiensis]|uniref:cholesterol side-chain cleavage enzyme, mitochondrial isoform X2 n=1 Tax=Alligator mississippiensis TaxID=8496 RepID=UPI0009073836|nr:cholesterol side-chain cleavage enzyme, mitochondrial isoform X2 [Alligator mississippiensis]